jgi:hypothetical protein
MLDTPTREQWCGSNIPLRAVQYEPQASMSTYPGVCLTADFANRKIGGGVLKGGAVQEEI